MIVSKTFTVFLRSMVNFFLVKKFNALWFFLQHLNCTTYFKGLKLLHEGVVSWSLKRINIQKIFYIVCFHENEPRIWVTWNIFSIFVWSLKSHWMIFCVCSYTISKGFPPKTCSKKDHIKVAQVPTLPHVTIKHKCFVLKVKMFYDNGNILTSRVVTQSPHPKNITI